MMQVSCNAALMTVVQDGQEMTTEHTAGTTSTNGRVRVERQIEEARAVLRDGQKGGRIPRKLLVPALLALGVIAVLRHFEQSTSG